MSFHDDVTDLPPAPPAESWQEHAPPTEPDAIPSPTLDPDLLRGARRDAGEAELLLAMHEPWNALAKAKRAHELLGHAIRAFERAAFVTSLVEDTHPRLSGERDVRPEAEAAQ